MNENCALQFRRLPLTEQADYWYDWFFADSQKLRRTEVLVDVTNLLTDKFGKFFKNPSIFFKHNPGWIGGRDCETTLVQLYDDEYPEGSKRVCLSIRKISSGRGYKAETQVELFTFYNGEDPVEPEPLFNHFDEALATAPTLAKMKSLIKKMEV